MVIIVSKNGRYAKKVLKTDIVKEDYLQKYIQDNPETIPIYEIDEDKRLLVVSREFPTNSGPLDALAIDQSGDIYIVETKLYRNPDKRKVVAQVIDYGASLWKQSINFDDFKETIEEEIKKKFSLTFEEKVKEYYALEDEDATTLFDNLAENLEEGRFKFVILMDHMEDRLKDLVQYVNENSKFDIYPVELEFYKYDEYEIMIPKLFGTEVKKNLTTTRSSNKRLSWTKETFLDKLRLDAGNNFDDYNRLYEFFKAKSDKIKYGTGAKNASYTPIINRLSETMFPLSIYSNGVILFKFSWEPIKNMLGPRNLDLTINIVLDELKNEDRPNISVEQLLHRDTRINIQDFKEGIKSVEKIFLHIKNLSF
jgi:hypothetical protein